MTNFFISEEDQKYIISNYPNFSKEKTLASLNTWQKIWKEFNIKYNFFYDHKRKGIAFKTQGKSGEKITQGFNAEYILQIGNVISRFYNINGIQKTLRTLKNPRQFDATLFEITCANHIFQHINFKIIEFSPKIFGGKKDESEADFKYICPHSKDEFFVECKNIKNFQRIQQSSIKKLFEKIFPELQKINKPNSFRVEISFNKLPLHWDKKLGEQLSSTINVMIKKKILCQDLQLNFPDNSIIIHIREKENKIRFIDGWIWIGNNSQNQLQCDYFLSEASNTDNAFLKQINKALNQLPKVEKKHIFIGLLPGMDLNKTIKLIKDKSLDDNIKISLYKEEDVIKFPGENASPMFIDVQHNSGDTLRPMSLKWRYS